MAQNAASTLKTLVKQNGGGKYQPARLFVAEVDGAPWYTESHFAVRALDDGRDPARMLLSSFNLALAPGTFEVNGTVAPTEQDPPRVDQLVHRAVEVDQHEVRPHVVVGAGAVLVRRQDDLVQVWEFADGAGELFGVRDCYVRFVEEHYGVDRWTRGTSETAPLVGWSGDTPAALVMPYRLS